MSPKNAPVKKTVPMREKTAIKKSGFVVMLSIVMRLTTLS
jgi:hypothetical protein